MLPAPKQPLKAPLRADPHGELVRLKEKIWQRYVSVLARLLHGWDLGIQFDGREQLCVVMSVLSARIRSPYGSQKAVLTAAAKRFRVRGLGFGFAPIERSTKLLS